MLHEILDDDHIQWHPPLIGHYTNFWPLLIWTLLPNLTFYLIVQGFHRTYATGAACQQRTLTPSGHLILSHLGFAFVPSNRNHTTYLWRLPNMTYLPKFTLPNWRGFNRIFATGVACQQGTLTPPDTWSCPTLGLACVLMSRPNLSWTCLVSGLLNFEHPSVLLFCHLYSTNRTAFKGNSCTTVGTIVFISNYNELCTKSWPFIHSFRQRKAYSFLIK